MFSDDKSSVNFRFFLFSSSPFNASFSIWGILFFRWIHSRAPSFNSLIFATRATLPRNLPQQEASSRSTAVRRSSCEDQQMSVHHAEEGTVGEIPGHNPSGRYPHVFSFRTGWTSSRHKTAAHFFGSTTAFRVDSRISPNISPVSWPSNMKGTSLLSRKLARMQTTYWTTMRLCVRTFCPSCPSAVPHPDTLHQEVSFRIRNTTSRFISFHDNCPS